MTPAQAEVVGRLEAAGAASRVLDLVRTTPLAGRGPVDSTLVDDRGLLRVCVSTLAALAPSLPEPPAAPRDRWAWLRRPRPEAPVTGPLDEVVAAWWEQRVRAGSGLRWRRVWSRLHAQDRPPLVTGTPPPLDPVGTDLLRRVNQVLATAPADVRARAEAVVERRRGLPLGVPRSYLAWAVDRAPRWGLGVPSTDAARPRGVPASEALDRALDELARPSWGEARWRDA